MVRLAARHGVPLALERCRLNGHEKGLVAYFATAFQSELTQEATTSYCEAWVPPTCTLVLLGWAVLVMWASTLTRIVCSVLPAYAPVEPFCFVSPRGDCGLSLFARTPLCAGQYISEYGGPRLPPRMEYGGE